MDGPGLIGLKLEGVTIPESETSVFWNRSLLQPFRCRKEVHNEQSRHFTFIKTLELHETTNYLSNRGPRTKRPRLVETRHSALRLSTILIHKKEMRASQDHKYEGSGVDFDSVTKIVY